MFNFNNLRDKVLQSVSLLWQKSVEIWEPLQGNGISQAIHTVVNKRKYKFMKCLSWHFYRVEKKSWLCGIMDLNQWWKEVIECKYSYMNYNIADDGLLQVFIGEEERFLDFNWPMPIEIPKRIWSSKVEKFIPEYRETEYDIDFVQVGQEAMNHLIENNSNYTEFFQKLWKCVFPCRDMMCHHPVERIFLLNEKVEPKSCQYNSMKIWKCDACWGILKFWWNEDSNPEGDYTTWESVTNESTDPNVYFDSKWKNDDMVEDFLTYKFLNEDAKKLLYDGIHQWRVKWKKEE